LLALSKVFAQSDQLKEAYEILEECFALKLLLYDENHEEVATTRSEIGRILRKLNRIDEAVSQHEVT
jgi:hypothetical protein